MTWHPQPWQDGDWAGEEPFSDSDSEEEDFPDDSATPLGNYILHGEAEIMSPCSPAAVWNTHPFVVLLSGLKQLLDAQQLCDVTLLVEGKRFMCHRYKKKPFLFFLNDSLNSNYTHAAVPLFAGLLYISTFVFQNSANIGSELAQRPSAFRC